MFFRRAEISDAPALAAMAEKEAVAAVFGRINAVAML